MDQAQTIHAEAGHVGVLHEVLVLELELVGLIPVTADGQHLCGRAVDRHDVRPCDAVLVLVPGHVVVHADFQNLVAVVVRQGKPLVFCFALLDVRVERDGLAQVHVAVEASHLQLLDVVLGLAHDVCHALRSTRTRCAVRDDEVFGRDKHCSLATDARVEIHLLERSAGQTQVVQHALVLGAVLRHLFRELVVHVLAHALRSFFLELVDRTDDFGLDRALRRERFNDGLALEADGRFGQHGGEHPAGTLPRLGALFVLHAQHFKAFDVHLDPLFAGVRVGLHQLNQLACEFLQLALVHVFGQVGTELFCIAAAFPGHQVDLETVHTDLDAFWVFDHDLNCRGVVLRDGGKFLQTHWGWSDRGGHAVCGHGKS